MEKDADLISRSRLLRDPYFQEDRYPESHLLRMAINEQRAVPAVEVVRCAECIHWCDMQIKLHDGTYRDYRPDEDPVLGVTLEAGINIGSHCTLHGCRDSSPTWFWARPDDFCSRGQRRETDG